MIMNLKVSFFGSSTISIFFEFGFIEEHKTFKRFNKSKRLLARSQLYKMIKDEKTSTMLPKSWKKSFNSGLVITAKMRFCNDCTDKIKCKSCDRQIDKNKEFESKEFNSNLLNRQAPKQIDYMFP